MRVIVRYHAAAKELCGKPSEELEFDAKEVSQKAFRAEVVAVHETLREYLPRMRLAINGDFADPGESLQDRDEVDILPPVAGGAPDRQEPGIRVLACAVTESPVSAEAVRKLVCHPSAGGIALFAGVVRNHADGKPVARLQYESHVALAEKEMHRILVALCGEHSDVRVAAIHRIGNLSIGDVAVVVAVSSAHRGTSFEVCRQAVDRIKDTVPIWKKEWAPDGTAHWVNLEAG